MAWPRKVNWERVDLIDNAQTLAKVLWSMPATKLSPERFWGYFIRLYQHTDDMFCVWQAAGALRDYLPIHPGVLPIPRELVFQMIEYRVEDANSIGIKLLVICDDISTHEVVEHLAAAIRTNDDSAECCSGVHETPELLRQVRSGRRNLDSVQVSELRKTLMLVSETNECDMLRGMASSCLEELDWTLTLTS